MPDNDQRRRDRPEDHDNLLLPSLPSFGSIARFAATCVGLLLIVCGAYYALSLGVTLLGALTNPAGVGRVLDEWQEAVGNESLVIDNEFVSVDGSRVLAIVVLGGVVVAAGWLLLSLVSVGARVVSIISGERRTLRKRGR